MSDQFTYLQVEAAVCFWEWVDHCTVSRSGEYPQMRTHRDEHGTCAMREECIRLADYCVQVYDLLPQDVAENLPYDWEIIPAIVGTIDWSVSPPARMVAADAARVVTRALGSQTQKKRPA
jgi:hypothetical protein